MSLAVDLRRAAGAILLIAAAASSTEARNPQPEIAECDRLAGHPQDPGRVAPGIVFEAIEASSAIAACSNAVKAHPGVPRLEYQLGRALQRAKRFEEAVASFYKAAGRNYAAGYFGIGTCYEEGTGVPKEASTALEWHRKAAELGHSAAQYRLGLAYATGNGVAPDKPAAAAWYRKAADQGYPPAQNNLGNAYDTGSGVPLDKAAAAAWYRKAAEQGLADAQYNLGLTFLRGEGAAVDATTGASWLRKAADQGFALAQNELGNSYEFGNGVPADPDTAAAWYRKAAEQGLADSQFRLAQLYENGKGVPKSDADAVRWYRMAADQGHTLAQNNLGVNYHEGRGVARDPVEGTKWVQRAAEKDNPLAWHNLGMYFANGAGIARDDAEAYYWYRLAAASANAEAQTRAARGLDDVSRRLSTQQVAAVERRIAQRLKPQAAPPASAPGSSADAAAAPPSDELIRTVQGRLARLGYGPGPADGKPGVRTAGAIRTFQADHQIPADGRFTPELAQRLNDALASEPAIDIRRLAVTPSPVAPGARFDVVLDISATDRPATLSVPLRLEIAILADGEAVGNAGPFTLEIRNGASTQHRQSLQAGRRIGAYQLTATLQHGGRRWQTSTSFRIE